MDEARCKSCGAEIVWAVSSKSGKASPIDAAPSQTGNVRLEERGEGVVWAIYDRRSQNAQPELGDDGVRHLSHFVTCPDSNRWRRK